MKYTTSGMNRRLPASPHTSRNAATSASFRERSAPLSPVARQPACPCRSHAASAPAMLGSPPAAAGTLAPAQRRRFSRHATKPSSSSEWRSPSASASNSASSTCSCRSMARSATCATCERQRDSRCSCWFRTLSAWKSNASLRALKRLADAPAKPWASGSTRRQLLASQAPRSSASRSPASAATPRAAAPGLSCTSTVSLRRSALSSRFFGRHHEVSQDAANSSSSTAKGSRTAVTETDQSALLMQIGDPG
mmetsp:Transcript_88962/g.251680  ORF Transcript_88962/g.251680 Transcript_88962/m.251680 type:complete len:251 (+) Transcript_88962:1941-2693(+)